jgi:hypothetical protein
LYQQVVGSNPTAGFLNIRSLRGFVVRERDGYRRYVALTGNRKVASLSVFAVTVYAAALNSSANSSSNSVPLIFYKIEKGDFL